MLSAYNYPLLGIFWTMLWFFCFVLWIWLVVMVFIDIFRSHDMGGFAKALWVICIIVLPLLGVLVYLIARGSKMHERAAEAATRDGKALAAAYGQPAGSSAADQLATLADLKEQGVLTDAEFEAQKAKLLGS